MQCRKNSRKHRRFIGCNALIHLLSCAWILIFSSVLFLSWLYTRKAKFQQKLRYCSPKCIVALQNKRKISQIVLAGSVELLLTDTDCMTKSYQGANNRAPCKKFHLRQLNSVAAVADLLVLLPNKEQTPIGTCWNKYAAGQVNINYCQLLLISINHHRSTKSREIEVTSILRGCPFNRSAELASSRLRTEIGPRPL